MKKFLIIILASLLLVGTSAIASSTEKSYVGMGIAGGFGTYSVNDTNNESYEFKDSYNSNSMIFKLGYIFESDNRFEFSYEIADHKDSLYSSVSGLNIDWIYVYPKNTFSPFWIIGLGSYENDNYDSIIAFNYGIGGLYDIDENLEFEASLKGKAIIWETIDTPTTTFTQSSVGMALYLGVNLKF